MSDHDFAATRLARLQGELAEAKDYALRMRLRAQHLALIVKEAEATLRIEDFRLAARARYGIEI